MHIAVVGMVVTVLCRAVCDETGHCLGLVYSSDEVYIPMYFSITII